MRFETRSEEHEIWGSLWRSEVLEGHYYLGGIQRPGSCQADDSWALASHSPGQTLVQRAAKGVGLIPRPLQSWGLGLLQQPLLEAYTQTLRRN